MWVSQHRVGQPETAEDFLAAALNREYWQPHATSERRAYGLLGTAMSLTAPEERERVRYVHSGCCLRPPATLNGTVGPRADRDHKVSSVVPATLLANGCAKRVHGGRRRECGGGVFGP